LVPEEEMVLQAIEQVGGLGNGSCGDAKVEVAHEHDGVGPNGGVGIASRRFVEIGGVFCEIFGNGFG
jgi:hypothetical protein